MLCKLKNDMAKIKKEKRVKFIEIEELNKNENPNKPINTKEAMTFQKERQAKRYKHASTKDTSTTSQLLREQNINQSLLKEDSTAKAALLTELHELTNHANNALKSLALEDEQYVFYKLQIDEIKMFIENQRYTHDSLDEIKIEEYAKTLNKIANDLQKKLKKEDINNSLDSAPENITLKFNKTEDKLIVEINPSVNKLKQSLILFVNDYLDAKAMLTHTLKLQIDEDQREALAIKYNKLFKSQANQIQFNLKLILQLNNTVFSPKKSNLDSIFELLDKSTDYRNEQEIKRKIDQLFDEVTSVKQDELYTNNNERPYLSLNIQIQQEQSQIEISLLETQVNSIVKSLRNKLKNLTTLVGPIKTSSTLKEKLQSFKDNCDGINNKYNALLSMRPTVLLNMGNELIHFDEDILNNLNQMKDYKNSLNDLLELLAENNINYQDLLKEYHTAKAGLVAELQELTDNAKDTIELFIFEDEQNVGIKLQLDNIMMFIENQKLTNDPLDEIEIEIEIESEVNQHQNTLNIIVNKLKDMFKEKLNESIPELEIHSDDTELTPFNNDVKNSIKTLVELKESISDKNTDKWESINKKFNDLFTLYEYEKSKLDIAKERIDNPLYKATKSIINQHTSEINSQPNESEKTFSKTSNNLVITSLIEKLNEINEDYVNNNMYSGKHEHDNKYQNNILNTVKESIHSKELKNISKQDRGPVLHWLRNKLIKPLAKFFKNILVNDNDTLQSTNRNRFFSAPFASQTEKSLVKYYKELDHRPKSL